MNRSIPGLPVHHQLTESTQTHVHRVGDAIQPSHPLSSPSPPALNLPSIRVFSNESALRIRWPKYWSFSFNISPSNYIWKMLHYMFPWEGLSIFSIPEVLKGSAVKNSVYLYLIQIFINIFVYVSLFG